MLVPRTGSNHGGAGLGNDDINFGDGGIRPFKLKVETKSRLQLSTVFFAFHPHQQSHGLILLPHSLTPTHLRPLRTHLTGANAPSSTPALNHRVATPLLCHKQPSADAASHPNPSLISLRISLRPPSDRPFVAYSPLNDRLETRHRDGPVKTSTDHHFAGDRLGVLPHRSYQPFLPSPFPPMNQRVWNPVPVDLCAGVDHRLCRRIARSRRGQFPYAQVSTSLLIHVILVVVSAERGARISVWVFESSGSLTPHHSDVLSLIVALYTIKLATSPSSSANSYGWQRAEILGALINGVFLVALCVSIFLEAIGRIVSPPEITNPKLIVVVGSLGLLSNIVGLFLFHGGSIASPHSHISLLLSHTHRRDVVVIVRRFVRLDAYGVQIMATPTTTDIRTAPSHSQKTMRTLRRSVPAVPAPTPCPRFTSTPRKPAPKSSRRRTNSDTESPPSTRLRSVGRCLLRQRTVDPPAFLAGPSTVRSLVLELVDRAVQAPSPRCRERTRSCLLRRDTSTRTFRVRKSPAQPPPRAPPLRSERHRRTVRASTSTLARTSISTQAMPARRRRDVPMITITRSMVTVPVVAVMVDTRTDR
jgi:hypothetical protein